MRDSDTVYLLDASIYIFRAWFGIPDHFYDQQGRPVNAVYGYFRNLLTHWVELQPKYMVAAFDESLFSGFRHELFPNYKANRALPDEALGYQLALCKLLTEQLGIPCLAHQEYEADDLIAWAKATAHKKGKSSVIISRDKDLAQLVGDKDCLWDWVDDVRLYKAELAEKWQVPLTSIPDVLALMGDSVDNIPGIPGIGEKTAKALVRHFGPLEHLYDNLDQVIGLPLRGAKGIHGKLAGTEQDALLFRQLIRLHYPDTALTLAQIKTQKVDSAQLKGLIAALELGKAFENLVEKYLC